MKIYSYLLENKSAGVQSVVEHIKLTQPTISYHLNDMKRLGILKSTKKGKEVLYSLNENCPHDSKRCILEQIKFNDYAK